MKLFEFAIASIVDANTGHGLEGKNLNVNYSAAIHAGHEIRAKSVLALFASIKHRIGQVISNYHVRAKNRRAINEISKLSARLLGDIGVERYELAPLRAGLQKSGRRLNFYLRGRTRCWHRRLKRLQIQIISF